MTIPLVEPQEKVQLARFVTMDISGTTLTLQSPDYRVTLAGPEPALRAIIAARSPIQISSAVQSFAVGIEVLLGCFEQLREAGMLLRLTADVNAPDVETYLDILHYNCEVRAQEIVRCPFWRTMMAGHASKALIEGWGIEFFHFVNQSNEYMPLAVAQTNLPTRLRHLMANHCVEESDHGRIILHGLTGLGIPESAVRQSVPLPTTAALINYLTELASANSLAYLATFGVMQQKRVRPPVLEYERFRDHLVTMYPTAATLFEAIHQHSMIDDKLDHSDLVFDKIVRAVGLPPRDQREAIATAIRRFAWSFSEFFSGILRWYGQGVVIAPRRPLTLAQFR